jgi:radical SAM family uncharacterized protein/radical SAM-linked protein
MEKYFSRVQKPSRYINNEWNCVRKDTAGASARICFCFPDLYELGASNLGVEILYKTANFVPGVSAERCYCPDKDMEELLRKENVRLFSLESQRPLGDFDVLGFSLQYELCFTNVLTMLDLAGVPLKSSLRTDAGGAPLVIGGGPVSFNPEPVADFFDAFVVGEGEDCIVEIMELVKRLKAAGSPRSEILKGLAGIEGIYVPALTIPLTGLIELAGTPALPATGAVKKRTVDISRSFFPTAQTVSNLITVHSRLNIEISRGCAHRCRFCQASGLYSPWRERDTSKVMEIVEKGIPATGYDQISLLSLSVTDHSGIEEMVRAVSGYCLKNDVSLSLPSLRCNRKSINILEHLVYPRRSNITLAVETASPAMRSVIDKQISDEDIFAFISRARTLGWDLVKLYFMIGLPGETMEDVAAIVTLVHSIKRVVPGMRFNVTLSPFVPKPHTPFQWCAMESEEALEEKRNFLYRRLKANVKAHSIRMSLLEGVFSRGDRRLSDVILKAWESGARFDHWHDRFNAGLWDEAFKSAGLDKSEYLSAKDPAAELPWDRISSGCSKETLLNGYNRALETISSRKPEPPIIPQVQPVYRPHTSPHQRAQSAPSVFAKYRLRFARTGRMRFLSHLEQIELIRRALKRASLPVAYSAGFHPQMKISFGPAISVGYESACEFADAVFMGPLDIRRAGKDINSALPAGFSLTEIRQVPNFFKPVSVDANLSRYSIGNLPGAAGKTEEEIGETLTAAKSAKEIIVEKKPGIKVNAAPMIAGISFSGAFLRLDLRIISGSSVKPERVAAAVFGLDESRMLSLAVRREDLFCEKTPGNLIRI